MGNKKNRKDKLCKRKDGRYVFVALDHGMTMGSFGHLDDMENLIVSLDKAKVDAIIVHKGIMQKCWSEVFRWKMQSGLFICLLLQI